MTLSDQETRKKEFQMSVLYASHVLQKIHSLPQFNTVHHSDVPKLTGNLALSRTIRFIDFADFALRAPHSAIRHFPPVTAFCGPGLGRTIVSKVASRSVS
jgi:hypothetical protein